MRGWRCEPAGEHPGNAADPAVSVSVTVSATGGGVPIGATSELTSDVANEVPDVLESDLAQQSERPLVSTRYRGMHLGQPEGGEPVPDYRLGHFRAETAPHTWGASA